jgi:hypothetical protein
MVFETLSFPHFLNNRLTDDGEAVSLLSVSSLNVPRQRLGKNFPAAMKLKLEVNLRPTVSRPVCLGVRHPSGTRDQFLFLLDIFFRRLRVCYFVAPSLTRGRVCNLLYNCYWALPEQSLLGRSPSELKAILYCLIWDSPNLEGQVPVFTSHRNRVTQLYPRALNTRNDIRTVVRVIFYWVRVIVKGL